MLHLSTYRKLWHLAMPAQCTCTALEQCRSADLDLHAHSNVFARTQSNVFPKGSIYTQHHTLALINRTASCTSRPDPG